jgi:guanylate kinase
MSDTSSGRLVAISGPSGAGKTTLVRRVFQECPRLVHSVSATTRPPRPGEVDGQDYHFLTREEFERKRQAGEFLECFEVYGHDFWYGTLESAVTPSLAAGKWVVLEIDVQGTMAVLKRYPHTITIFVRPRSMEQLERQLRNRGTESNEAIERRLEVARRELAFADRYQHQVLNDDIDRAVREICDILIQQGVLTHDR